MLKRTAIAAALLLSVAACETPNRIESPFVESDLIRKIQPGHILVRRTDSFESAVIANINRGDYSHCATFIGTDENGDLALIDMSKDGLTKKVFSDYISQNNGVTKFAVLRFEDQEWSARAARWLLTKVGKVEFDYSWDIRDSSKWFCCEAIMVAFAETSDGEVNVPSSLSDIGELYDTSFAKLAGIKNKKIVTSNDFLNDSRFSVVWEWEKPSRETDYYDAIFEKIFEWEINGYEHIRKTEISGLAHFVKFIRDNSKIFSERMGKDTPIGLVELGIRYHNLSGILKLELEKIDDPDSPLSENELRNSLEQLRREDKVTYDNYTPDIMERERPTRYMDPKPIFHHFFRQKE